MTRSFVQHMSVNAAKLVAMRRDRELHDAVVQCELITADGQAVVWASRLLGDPLPERVAGIDLMHAMLDRATEREYSVYILGARQEMLERAVGRIRALHPSLRLVGFRNGYYSDEEEPAVARAIADTEADVLLVAMSSPRKELFLARHRSAMDVPFVMGVGGAIDVVAGLRRRAPLLLQRLGVEWLWRLGQEPVRLGRRYVTTNAAFMSLVAHEWLAQRPSRRER
jgi:N-acetylglucosaminyldiphosphoundecaprenol N-acetyl-beta-D-mannosaminyltransferase